MRLKIYILLLVTHTVCLVEGTCYKLPMAPLKSSEPPLVSRFQALDVDLPAAVIARSRVREFSQFIKKTTHENEPATVAYEKYLSIIICF